jgi:hypothetical protein
MLTKQKPLTRCQPEIDPDRHAPPERVALSLSSACQFQLRRRVRTDLKSVVFWGIIYACACSLGLDSPNPKTRLEMKQSRSVASIQTRKGQSRSTRLETIPMVHF